MPIERLIQKQQGIIEKLNVVYGEEKGHEIYHEIKKIVEAFIKHDTKNQADKRWVSEKDVILITYGDQIKEVNKPPLESLHGFIKQYMEESISGIHILPFYPYTSDDGFSVTDYFQVNPDLGVWGHVEEMAQDFDLMFDAVINHISAKSEWFQEYINGNAAYEDFFIEADPALDYSSVRRPRALPLLSPYATSRGTKYIWTTFSEDQIDLNYQSEKVLLKIIQLLFFYIAKGARYLRLDAIGFLWKEQNTSCIHLDKTHKIIQLFRDIFEAVAPDTVIITETNVPHKENISYLGDGSNEAHMVYQFPLPPLTLHTFLTGNARILLEWAEAISPLSEQTTFFNFLASHDGIGVTPVKEILTEEEIEEMVEKVQEYGGYVSYKNNGNGTKSPYELNIN